LGLLLSDIRRGIFSKRRGQVKQPSVKIFVAERGTLAHS
jgi:hypothetical protein